MQSIRISGVMIALGVLCASNCVRSNSTYTVADWRADRQKQDVDRNRASMGQTLHRSGELIGKRRDAILDLLGPADDNSQRGVLIYGLGPDPSFGIDILRLRIIFGGDDKVTATEIEVY